MGKMGVFASILIKIEGFAEGTAKDLRLLPVGGTGTRGKTSINSFYLPGFRMTETSDRTPSHLPGTGIQFPIGARKDQHLLRLLNCDSSFRPCDTLRSEPK